MKELEQMAMAVHFLSRDRGRISRFRYDGMKKIRKSLVEPAQFFRQGLMAIEWTRYHTVPALNAALLSYHTPRLTDKT